jgi:3-methylfumaryl-CoA hydratase
MTTTQGSLAEHLREWAPAAVETSRVVDPWAAEAFAGVIDAARPAPGIGGPLPPLWHWFVLTDHPRHAELGPDGHPTAGRFLPPIPARRRMFAGGRLRQHAPIPVGSRLDCRASLAAVEVKTGRTGELAFVTTRYELSVDGHPVASEEQDIVYRSEPAGRPRRPAVSRPAAADPPFEPSWQLRLAVDSVLLFRFSALTYNGHRIHFDRPYATEVEGYPDLVVHGPLLALLALELPRTNAPGQRVSAFEYRLVRPTFASDTVGAVARVGSGRAELVVSAEGAAPSLTATLHLDPMHLDPMHLDPVRRP